MKNCEYIFIRHTFANIASSSGILPSCAFIVCEKNAYDLSGISKSIGTCLTPMITDAGLKSSVIIAPAFSYSCMVYALLADG